MEEHNLTPRKRTFKPKTPTKPKVITDSLWYGLDLRNQGMKNLSPNLFDNTFIYELNLENNKLENLPSCIRKLKNLEILNISNNKIKNIPPELGKLINLREVYANNNQIRTLPTEIGTLYNCNKFELDGNLLTEEFLKCYKEGRGRGVINFCKEHHTDYPSPSERQFVDIEKGYDLYLTIQKDTAQYFTFSLGSYNLLTNCCATEQMFGYAPSWVLKWENRKIKLLDEIVKYNFDILCTQEMETQAFSKFFRNELEDRCDYDSLFYPKGRAKTMTSNVQQVDGCATFWKKKKFSMIEHKCLEFMQIILNDKRYNTNIDIINRNMNKDNIALITVLKTIDMTLIVANVHLFWDPDYKDVKLIQSIILLEELAKYQAKYPKAGILISGDFNSLSDSDTYKLITTGKIEPLCKDFNLYNYSTLSKIGYSHSLNLKDSYNQIVEDKESADQLMFTNYTPHFMGIIDYIFFNKYVKCKSVLSGLDCTYANEIVGLPSIHLPSDHIIIGGRYAYKLDNKIKK